MKTESCFLCQSKKLRTVIDLGYHPLADSFLKEDQIGQPEVRYPLYVVACEACGHLMNGYMVSAEARYQETEYSYDSSNSPVAVKHFEDFAHQVSEKVGIDSGDLVIDIGSNVGTFLGKFREATGCDVRGVEPSPNIAKIAEDNGVTTINNFFNSDAVDEIKKVARPKVITGTNVYNHIEDQETFAKNIAALLADDGSAVFEVPYAGTLVDETSFDTIYLEHASYFFIKPLKEFWAKHGLAIHHVELNDYMGGSVRIYLARHLPESPEVTKLIEHESEAGYFTAERYKEFMQQVIGLKMDLMKQLYEIKAKGGVVIGIGAATKGNTLLNFCGIDSSLLEYVTDASPLKIGKYTPGSHIPIKDDKDIDETITHGLILPWNIGDFLSKKLAHLGLEFIVPHLKK